MDKILKDPPGAAPKAKQKPKTRDKSTVKVRKPILPTNSASDSEEKPSGVSLWSGRLEIAEASHETPDVRTRRKEQMVELAVSFLSRLQALMGNGSVIYPECKPWIEQCMSMKTMGIKPRTFIGVLGATGAGKSTLLNALLREEELLPTNPFRASTAVVIEVSYNQSNDPKHAYVAKIEFCTTTEWIAEFDSLRRDIEDLTESDSPAGESDPELAAAKSKLEAVYPGEQLSTLLAMTDEEIVQDPNVAQILGGSSKMIFCTTAKKLSNAINDYVDSGNSSENKALECWPLVRLVKIYTKAEILEDGLVLVDLPGVGDSNVARGKVAKGYLKNLNHIWIVSDIRRAVSDRVAESLLDTSLKEHLFMNENYDDKFVAFITTWTDAISAGEAIRTLHLKNTILKEDLEREDMLSTELAALLRAPDLKRECDVLDESVDIKQPNSRIAVLNQEIDKLSSSIRCKCIQARNKYTRDHLSVQFKDGIVELVKEFTASDSSKSGVKKMDQGALDALTENLSVFCVSSKAFQKLLGMLRLEKPMPEFSSTEETGIPGLEEFATRCTLRVREAASDKFLAEVASRVSSIRYWAEEDQNEHRLHEAERKTLSEDIGSAGVILKKVEKRANTNMRQNIRRSMKEKLFRTCIEAIEAGTKQVPAQATSFAKISTKSRTELPWCTWRAVVRRHGKYEKQNPRQLLDLNKRLTKPFINPILGPWRDLFRVKLPLHHSIYMSLILEGLATFEVSVKRSIKVTCGVFPPLQRILSRISADQERVISIVDGCLRTRQAGADDARDKIPGYIKKSLMPFYEQCLLINGKGSLKGMKDLLDKYVEKDAAKKMFTQASKATLDELRKVDASIGREPSHEVQKILDYLLEELHRAVNASAKAHQTVNIGSKNIRNRVLGEILELEEQLASLTPAPDADYKTTFGGLARLEKINMAKEYIEFDDDVDEQKAPF